MRDKTLAEEIETILYHNDVQESGRIAQEIAEHVFEKSKEALKDWLLRQAAKQEMNNANRPE